MAGYFPACQTSVFSRERFSVGNTAHIFHSDTTHPRCVVKYLFLIPMYHVFVSEQVHTQGIVAIYARTWAYASTL